MVDTDSDLANLLRSAVTKMRAHNLVPQHGEVAVDDAYWSEVLDPEHKPGHGRDGNVAYLDANKRKPHVVGFNGDKLVVKMTNRFKTGLFPNTEGGIIFVIDRDRKFYAGIKSIGNFHHSSFLSGAQALAAGTMQITSNYTITQVNNHSGHYKPTITQLKLTAVVMHLQGADLNQIPFRFTPPTGGHHDFATGHALLESEMS